MLAELAQFSLILALCFSGLLVVVPLLGTWLHDQNMMAAARALTNTVFAFTALAFCILIALFLQDDFSVMVVAKHSNLSLPDIYKVTAIWGGHEGSLLLWVFILTAWMLAVSLFSKSVPVDMQARVLAVMGIISCGFLLFMLLTSNPFERILPNIPTDGRDLNPLLQDFGMAIHPPMLYFGYVGFSVAFAFAIAGLLSGEFDTAWVRWVRPWTTAAWGFLTIGISLGSWWAYYELGWGGWWFWDPVENASFMPWLVGTALMHSLAVTEKRGLFKSWTILLAIFAFSLSLLGTFLVRSGVLTSVHAFAADPDRGLFILAFLGLVVGGSLILFALRAPAVQGGGRFSLLSREMFLLINNILLVVACLVVLVGTLFPLVADFFELGKYSVGPPYFNKLFVPLMLLLILFMAPGPLLRWKRTRGEHFNPILKVTVPVAVVLTLVFSFAYEADWNLTALAGFATAGWLLAMTAVDFKQKLQNASSISAGLKRLSLSFYAMHLAHLGLVITAVGIGVVSAYSEERDISMHVGETVTVKDYSFTFVGSKAVQGPNYHAEQGQFSVMRDGEQITVLLPEKRRYLSQMGNVMTEAAIHPRLSRDIYVAMGEPLDNGAWAVRLHYKPFVRWIWLGTILMGLGALLAIADKRYR